MKKFKNKFKVKKDEIKTCIFKEFLVQILENEDINNIDYIDIEVTSTYINTNINYKKKQKYKNDKLSSINNSKADENSNIPEVMIDG